MLEPIQKASDDFQKMGKDNYDVCSAPMASLTRACRPSLPG